GEFGVAQPVTHRVRPAIALEKVGPCHGVARQRRVARQQRVSFADEDFYLDLVFYNYKLKCFLLVDLKLGKLTHQDMGQMDTYVRL
ncbi:MAG: DUF1016 domain-containing protein, partial [Nitrosomonas sp.]|nr:DUF1016 domain-containing protein [Nitrosomonas sp.]